MPGESGTDLLTRVLVDEVLDHVPLPRWGWLRAAMGRAMWRPIGRFARLAAGFERRAADGGFLAATEWFLPVFAEPAEVIAEGALPASGPLLIVSNHPGTVDALVIAAAAGREDLRILTSRIPFLTRLPATRRQLVFTSPDRRERRDALWSVLAHLERGGAALMFPSGGIDPDPAFMPAAANAFRGTLRTVAAILGRSRETRLVLAAVSGVLRPECVRHPFTLVGRKPRDRQRIAEYLQVVRQVRAAGRLRVRPTVRFSAPVRPAHIERGVGEGTAEAAIERRALRLLERHAAGLGVRGGGRAAFPRPAPT